MKMDKESQVENINDMLKTCPFCGGKAEVVFAYDDPWEEGALRCTECGVSFPFSSGNKEVWKIIENWNRRVNAEDQQKDKLELNVVMRFAIVRLLEEQHPKDIMDELTAGHILATGEYFSSLYIALEKNGHEELAKWLQKNSPYLTYRDLMDAISVDMEGIAVASEELYDEGTVALNIPYVFDVNVLKKHVEGKA